MVCLGIILSFSVSVLGVISATEVPIGSKHVQRIACVLVTECPIYMKVLRKRPLTQNHIEMIRAAHCGFQGDIELVWCPYVINTVPTPGEGLLDTSTNSNLQMRAKKMDEVTTKESKVIPEMRETAKTNISPKTGATVVTLVDENEAQMIERKNRLMPGDHQCGKYEDNRIVGGDATGLDQYPWTAMLMYQKRVDKLIPGCGGSLISKRYVVTAAHCITTNEPPAMVVLGEYDIRNETDCIYSVDGTDCSLPVQRFQIENITIHPGWQFMNSRPLYDDLALLRLDKDVIFHDFVAPICLYPQSKDDLKPGTKLIAAGWGLTEKRRGSNIKRSVVLPIVNRAVCSQKVNLPIGPSQICAGGVKGKDTCKGDSGGPLMHFETGTQNFLLAGVVSFGISGCGRFDRPAIYTWMPHYTNWIYENIY